MIRVSVCVSVCVYTYPNSSSFLQVSVGLFMWCVAISVKPMQFIFRGFVLKEISVV